MNVSSTGALRPQSKFTFSQLLALASAGLLASASILTNVSSAVSRQPDVAGKVVGGSIALAVALIAAIGLAAALQAFARKQFVLSALAGIAFALSAAFSVSSALGVLGGSRLQASMSVGHVENERTRLAFERRNAVNELASIAPARSTAEITPELARRLSVPGVNGCTQIDGPATRMHCPVIAALQSELATSERRSALTGMIAQHDRDIAKLGAPTIANKDAAAVAHVFTALGMKLDSDTVNTALMLLAVLVLELGPALSLATAAALRSNVPMLCDAPSLPVSASVEAVSNVPAFIATDAKGLAKEAADGVLRLVKDAGGELRVSSKNALAKQLGATSATLGRGLAALAGAIVLTQSADGLIVKLAA